MTPVDPGHELVFEREGIRLYRGNCLAVLPTLADASVDAVVCDPPYELAFMGRKWDASGVSFQVTTWEAVARVMKPGAFLLAFGGTRTYHRMACAIEDAGFEIRDSIHWIYASGFPKSLDVSKAIDAAAGAEREALPDPQAARRNTVAREYWSSSKPGTPPVTAPATDAAKQWQGWGTALKPAHEPIIVARKPLSEPTVAANVLEHGTGALNIDACRVRTTDNLNGGAYANIGTPRNDGWGMQRGCAGEYQQPSGRWPTNTVFTHHSLCQPCGERRVKTGTHVGRNSAGKEKFPGAYGSGLPETGSDRGYADLDGTEVVMEWRCVEGLCPVAELDRQEPDSSRFFPCFSWTDADFVPFRYIAKAFRRERGHDNTHSTVKPLELMKWLTRLCCPPGGTILDPFVGSSTTLCAAIAEGFDAIGIEQDPGYCEIGQKRLRLAFRRRDRPHAPEPAREPVASKKSRDRVLPLFGDDDQ